jgi:hypothetical protein
MGMHRRDRKCIQNVGQDLSEDLGMGEMIVLEWILRK